MKLRFEVDQAHCFRNGIDAPRSVVTVEVDPKELGQDDRNIIADHLEGIDVRSRLLNCATEEGGLRRRVIAKEPTLDSLLKALRDEVEFGAEVKGSLSAKVRARCDIDRRV